jgi:hypothetical protein
MHVLRDGKLELRLFELGAHALHEVFDLGHLLLDGLDLRLLGRVVAAVLLNFNLEVLPHDALVGLGHALEP